MTADGEGVVSHVGARLLGDVAAACGLDARLGEVAGRGRLRRSVHDPGRVLTDLAVSLADGGEAISDLAVLRDQGELFGPVASTATAWRTLHAVADRGADGRAGLHAARAAARERAWLARTELGRSVPPVTAGGRTWQGLVIDIDATLVTCHSEKEQAAPTFKGGFGFHPVLAFLDNTGEALAGILRPGNAGANTAADHITIIDLALAQLPDHERHGQPILIRADGAGATKVWLQHLHTLRTERNLDYSVGCTMTDAVQQAILALPEHAWTPAVQVDGELRDGGDVAELTGLLPAHGVDLAANGWPPGMRVIVRRERPHPGAQLTFSDVHGYRFQTFATSTRVGQLAALEARHRAHARVEDRIRTGKDTGYGRFPARHFAINAVWLEVALIAADLLAWTQTTLLDGDLAAAEPKTLRYRLLRVAARITHGQRKTWIRIHTRWPRAADLAAAFGRLRRLPTPG